MATTYSIGTTGLIPGQSTNLLYDLPDTDLSGNVCATPGGLQGVAQTGDIMLCKGPDGAQAFYRLDTERSTPAIPVLLKVYG